MKEEDLAGCSTACASLLTAISRQLQDRLTPLEALLQTRYFSNYSVQEALQDRGAKIAFHQNLVFLVNTTTVVCVVSTTFILPGIVSFVSLHPFIPKHKPLLSISLQVRPVQLSI